MPMSLTGAGRQYNQAMQQKRSRCPECDSGILTGDGRCKHCHGSGVNLNMASDVPQCLFCKGTGTCQNCEGEGLFPPFDDTWQNDIQKLFE